MLLSFRVANVRSLRDEQELSFVAPEDAEVERAAARETVLSDGRRLSVHTALGGQIRLTEKDERGATALSSVADREPTQEEDLTAACLAGSFGAVPRMSTARSRPHVSS
ncbi:hypothetical protein [Streptomyces beigongshangae]|uniref:hypothetical protein n=1 Tax=Streptomyces beigongshangae TaxID=2841597 RepID=UPI001C84276E|nr:hypothetical protein [Streptomyces sp. REN17]